MQSVDNKLHMCSANALTGTIKLFEYSLQILDDHLGHSRTPTNEVPLVCCAGNGLQSSPQLGPRATANDVHTLGDNHKTHLTMPRRMTD